MKTTAMRGLIFGYACLLGQVLDWSWTVFGISQGFLREGNPFMVLPLAVAPLGVLAVKVTCAFLIVPLYILVARHADESLAKATAVMVLIVTWTPNVQALILALRMALA